MPGDEDRSRSPDVAQGGRVIAMLDMDRGAPADQAMFYVELTRARDNVVLLTDDREALIEALEASPAEEVSALRAIGEQFEVSTSASAPAETITQSPSPRKPAVLDETTRERRTVSPTTLISWRRGPDLPARGPALPTPAQFWITSLARMDLGPFD